MRIHLTEEHLVPLRQYIYNIVCECEGTPYEEVLTHILFKKEVITQYIERGIQHYEQLLYCKRSIVEDTNYSFFLKYYEHTNKLGTRQTMATKHNEQALRILLHFNVENNVYKCTYLNESLQQQTIEIERELVESNIQNLQRQHNFEVKLYERVLNVQEHTRALIFFHALGMHNTNI